MKIFDEFYNDGGGGASGGWADVITGKIKPPANGGWGNVIKPPANGGGGLPVPPIIDSQLLPYNIPGGRVTENGNGRGIVTTTAQADPIGGVMEFVNTIGVKNIVIAGAVLWMLGTVARGRRRYIRRHKSGPRRRKR